MSLLPRGDNPEHCREGRRRDVTKIRVEGHPCHLQGLVEGGGGGGGGMLGPGVNHQLETNYDLKDTRGTV